MRILEIAADYVEARQRHEDEEYLYKREAAGRDMAHAADAFATELRSLFRAWAEEREASARRTARALWGREDR